MVWTEPRIFVDGPHLTAEMMNEISDNLRETAPAKAQHPGDLFYATGANSIERLPLGENGQFLIPGMTRPQWGSVPTPITSKGDLVVGDENGNPVRLPAVDGVRVLMADGTELRWVDAGNVDLNIGVAERWWELDEWWSESSQDDMEISDMITVPQLVARDITFPGGFVECLYSVCIIRCRTVRLNSHTTIVAKNHTPTDFARGETDGGSSGSNHGGNGGLLAGGGGGGGTNLADEVNGSDGANASGTLDEVNIYRAAIGDGDVVCGGSGADGIDNSRTRPSSLRGLGGKGGGAIIFAANEVITGGFAFRLRCEGENGNSGLYEFNSGRGHGGGGGGGGGTVIAVARTGHSSITAEVRGGRGGGGGDGVPSGNYGSNGGDGGNGYSFIADSFPLLAN